MSTQQLNSPARENRIIRIITRPTKENDYWCDFEWEKATGEREARCMQITQAQIDYMGYVTEDFDDDFAPEGIVITRGRGAVEYAKQQNELIDYEIRCIVMFHQEWHEPSELFVSKKITGKRKNRRKNTKTMLRNITIVVRLLHRTRKAWTLNWFNQYCNIVRLTSRIWQQCKSEFYETRLHHD